MFWRRRKIKDHNELQSEFLKSLNHHIRDPLNAIVLLTDLLIQTVRADDEEIHSALLTIARASSHLERDLRSILDLYKIETGGFALAPATVKVGELVKRKLAEIRGTAKGKGIELVFAAETPEITVTVDRYCFEQALENLLHNALTYTVHGQITARLYVEPKAAICVDIEDTGPGIDPVDLPKLFEAFFQGKNGHPDGSGLGLASAKRYLELNGAELSVKSEQGKGSVFTIHLPKA
jgi:signal transduction histidine kinase